MKLAEMLRLYLAARNISQKEASAQMGISESTLSRFLDGTSSPDADNFMRILYWATVQWKWSSNEAAIDAARKK